MKEVNYNQYVIRQNNHVYILEKLNIDLDHRKKIVGKYNLILEIAYLN